MPTNAKLNLIDAAWLSVAGVPIAALDSARKALPRIHFHLALTTKVSAIAIGACDKSAGAGDAQENPPLPKR